MAVKLKERPAGSGVWWVFIDHNNKRKAKKIGRDRAEAEKVAAKIEAGLVLKTLDLGDKEKAQDAPLFKDYCQVWLEGYVKVLRRASTYERYRDVLRLFVNPVLGQLPIDQIRRGHVRDLLLKVHGQGYSRSTVCIVRDVVSGVLGHALDEELIQVNPVRGVTKKLQLEQSRKVAVEPMKPAEVALFLETCLERFPEHHPFFLTLFRTGMRLGEALALQWGDIDWFGKFIQVQRSFKGGRITPTKTGKVRRVDMSDQLIEALKALQTKRKKEALEGGRGMVEFLFHQDGQPIAQNSIRNYWKRILRRAGLRDMRIHDARHTFASQLLSYGESPVYVKEQLGHSSIQMTVDIYGHLIPSGNRAAVNQLDFPATFPQPIRNQEKAKGVTI